MDLTVSVSFIQRMLYLINSLIKQEPRNNHKAALFRLRTYFDCASVNCPALDLLGHKLGLFRKAGLWVLSRFLEALGICY